ncbi:hypothetical protein T222_13420 [Pseudomonas aeruginosa LES400]|nr:hypothetical protein T222_13420 [Pseudomonas aeruginosa LES400]
MEETDIRRGDGLAGEVLRMWLLLVIAMHDSMHTD